MKTLMSVIRDMSILVEEAETVHRDYMTATEKLDEMLDGIIDEDHSDSMDEAFESIEEAMDNWTITVDKAVNKLKKGDEQKVKARSAFEAISKAMKLWGDPSLKAAPASYFKVTKESLEEEVELVEHVSKRQQDTLKGFSSNSYGISDSLISAVNNVVAGKAESVEMPTGEENSVIEQGVQELGEAKNPNIGKIVQGVTDLQNKLKGKDGRDIGKVLTQIRKGDADRAQGVIRGLDTDIRDQLQDVLEPLGAWKKGVYVSESIVEGADGGTGDKEEYQKFFQAALKKFGASSPADLDDKKKKEFYDYVDANWEGDDEVAENALKEFKADGEDSESADPTDVKAKQPKKAKKAKAESKDGTDDEDKKGGEKVEINPKLDEEKRDQILKGLQEKIPEFKKKYGDRCEEVMYATATKLAMK